MDTSAARGHTAAGTTGEPCWAGTAPRRPPATSALAPSGAGQRFPALRVRPSCPAEDAASPAPRTHSANGSRSRRSEHAVASGLQCTVCQWGTPGLHPRWQRSAHGSNRSHADLTWGPMTRMWDTQRPRHHAEMTRGRPEAVTCHWHRVAPGPAWGQHPVCPQRSRPRAWLIPRGWAGPRSLASHTQLGRPRGHRTLDFLMIPLLISFPKKTKAETGPPQPLPHKGPPPRNGPETSVRTAAIPVGTAGRPHLSAARPPADPEASAHCAPPLTPDSGPQGSAAGPGDLSRRQATCFRSDSPARREAQTPAACA